MAGGRKTIDANAEDLKRDLGFLAQRSDVLAVMLFGSAVRGDSLKERSDIDICVVARDCKDHTKLLREIWRKVDVHRKGYDVRIFEDLPLYIKIQVIREGKVVFTKDVYELYEYFYLFRKLWNDQEYRQKLTKEEALGLFSHTHQ